MPKLVSSAPPSKSVVGKTPRRLDDTPWQPEGAWAHPTGASSQLQVASGGKGGGGRPDLAQGGGTDISGADAAITAVKLLLK